jgi:hypothetical protein
MSRLNGIVKDGYNINIIFMKYFLKYKKLKLVSLVLLGVFMGFVLPIGSTVIAAPIDYVADVTCPSGQTLQSDGNTCCPNSVPTNNDMACLFAKYINPAVQLLSAAIGLVVVIATIVGAIEYITSEGDPQRANAGRKHITNALLALFAFVLLYAFLQFLIPGGLLNG